MGWEHKAPLQEGSESALLPVEAQRLQRLQQGAADVQPVCGGQRYLLCCRVLGTQCESERRKQVQQVS